MDTDVMVQSVYRFCDVVKGDTVNKVDFQILINEFPLDITGYVIKLDWVSLNGTPLISLTTADDSIEITNPTAGEFRINSYIADLPPKLYTSDIEFKSPDDVIKSYIKVLMQVLPGYTV
jgi:hypothetical protein